MLQILENIEITGIAVTAVIGGLVAALFRYVGAFFARNKTQNEAIKRQNDAIMTSCAALLRYNIVAARDAYTRSNKISKFARESIEAMYEEYRKLGGNGFVEGIMLEIRALPVDREGEIA